jgi:hypothetical protein
MESGKERLMSTEPEAFEAENALETALIAAHEGKFTLVRLLNAVLDADIYVASKGEMAPDGSGFSPLMLGDDKEQRVCIFSARSRAAKHREMAPYVLQTKGRMFFQWLPAGLGVSLNPGFTAQFVISPEGMAGIKTELAALQAAAPSPPT